MTTLIEARNISKIFSKGPSKLHILKNVNLSIHKHEFIAIMGPSGSGKTTLMNIIGCLDSPSEGKLLFDGRDIGKASDSELSLLRSARIGFVFQSFHLLPHLNAFENVELPFLYSSYPESEIRERVLSAIERVGLTDRLTHKPFELSGGEMQRVAIARALATDPDVIVADEPTGSLDTKTGSSILELFEDLHDNGATIVMVTHDNEVAGHAEKKYLVKDGEIVL